jgi:hypothetical protein
MLLACGTSLFLVEVIYVLAYILPVVTDISVLYSDAFVNLQWGVGKSIDRDRGGSEGGCGGGGGTIGT